MSHKDCVFQSRDNGTWKTDFCGTNRAYICKATANKLPNLSGDESGKCPKFNSTIKQLSWVDLDKRSRYCYWYSLDFPTLGTVTWADASYQCKKRGGSLVSLHSDHEIKLITSKLKYKQYNIWIGLMQNIDGM